MDPHERFYRRSLRDVLTAQGTLTAEQAEELSQSAQDSNEPFGGVVVDAGYLTAWDLTKVVATHYQVPVLPLAGYRWDRSLADGVPPALLHQYGAIPVGRFGRAWSFAVYEPPTREMVESLRHVCGNAIFFFAADIGEVRKVLRESVKVVDVTTDTGWQSIFDSGDRKVLDELRSTPE
jgi:hypothetical protein